MVSRKNRIRYSKQSAKTSSLNTNRWITSNYLSRPLRNYIELFWEFFIDDFKLRYKRSYLGVLWAIFKPLFQFWVLYNVWVMFRSTTAHTLFILAGIVLYNVFTMSLNYGMSSLKNKAHVILKIYFPREIVVFAASAVALMDFFFNFWVVMMLAYVGGLNVTLWKLAVALWGAALTMFLLGSSLALLFSVWYLRLRDIRHLVDLVLYVLFWLVPVFYPLEMLEGNPLQKIVINNPLTYVIIFVDEFFKTNLIRWHILRFPLMVGSVSFLVGILYFKRAVKRVAEYY